MRQDKLYSHHNIYMIDADYAGRYVGNKVEVIKNSKMQKFETITKEEFLKWKTEENSIIIENDIAYIIRKEFLLYYSLTKLQGKI